jgi:hypothetical protein
VLILTTPFGNRAHLRDMTYKMVNNTQAAITAESTSVSLDFLRLMALRRPLMAGKRDPTCTHAGCDLHCIITW